MCGLEKSLPYHTFTIFMILILSASPSLASCKKCKFEWNTIRYCVTGPTMPINQLITNTTFMCFSSHADRIDLRIICRKHREVKCPQGIFTIPCKEYCTYLAKYMYVDNRAICQIIYNNGSFDFWRDSK